MDLGKALMDLTLDFENLAGILRSLTERAEILAGQGKLQLTDRFFY